MSERSTSSHRNKRRRLATEITTEEAERRRLDANSRLQTVWDDIIARYSVKDADDNDEAEDVIDWEEFELSTDRGVIRGAEARPVGFFAKFSGQREQTPSESEASTDDEIGLAALTTRLASEEAIDEGEIIDLCSTSEGEDEDDTISVGTSEDEKISRIRPGGPLTRAQSVITGTKPRLLWPVSRRRRPAAEKSSDEERLPRLLRRRTASIAKLSLRNVRNDSPDPLAITPKTPVLVVLPPRGCTRTRSPSPPAHAANSGSDTSDYEDFISRLTFEPSRSTLTPPSSLASDVSPFAIPALPLKRASFRKPLTAPQSKVISSVKPLPIPSLSPSLRSALRKPGAPPRLSLAPSPTPSSVRFASPPPDLRPSAWTGDVSDVFDVPVRSASPLKQLVPLKSDKGEVFYEWPRSVSVELDAQNGRRGTASMKIHQATNEIDLTTDFDELLSPKSRRRSRSVSRARYQPYVRRQIGSPLPVSLQTTVRTRIGSVTVSAVPSSPSRARSAAIARPPPTGEVRTRAGTVTVSTVIKTRSVSITPSVHGRSLRSNSVLPSLYSRRLSALPC